MSMRITRADRCYYVHLEGFPRILTLKWSALLWLIGIGLGCAIVWSMIIGGIQDEEIISNATCKPADKAFSLDSSEHHRLTLTLTCGDTTVETTSYNMLLAAIEGDEIKCKRIRGAITQSVSDRCVAIKTTPGQ